MRDVENGVEYGEECVVDVVDDCLADKDDDFDMLARSVCPSE